MRTLHRLLCSLWLLIPACTDTGPAPEPPPPPTSILPTISISPTGQTIAVGDSLQFHAVTNVSGTTGFAWVVNAPALASVTSTGWLKALGPGMVMVRACVQPNVAVCGEAMLTIH